jgi:tetratricopeptide (TPR) repeat protein
MFKWLRRGGTGRQAEPAPTQNFEQLVAQLDQFIARSDFKPALTAIRQHESQFSDRIELQVRLGIVLYSLEQYNEAVRALEAALVRDPGNESALKFLVGACYYAREFRQGLAIGRRAIAAGKADAQVHNAMGAMYLQSGDLEHALESFQTAIKLNPADTQALSNLEAVKTRFSAIGVSETDTEEIGRIRDGWIETYTQKLLDGVLTVEEAERFSQTIGIRRDTWPLAMRLVDDFANRPDLSAVLAANLSTICIHAGESQKALALSEFAFADSPTRVEMRNTLGGRLVRQGDERWTDGWKLLAETNRLLNPNNYVDTVPVWRGEFVEGKRLFVHFDQGVGDALIAMRFVPMLSLRGIEVVLWVIPALEMLVESLASYAQIVRSPFMPDPRAFGCHYSSGLFDLVAGLRLGPDEIGEFDRLPAPSAATELLQQLATSRGRAVVALITFGNPRRTDDWFRSVPINALEPLKSLPGVDWVNLSTDSRPELGALLGEFKMIDPTPNITSFGDTAAVLAAVHCSAAHLAAALGRPLWVLKPTIDDWRWQIGDIVSPWWPAARIFAADGVGEWKGTIEMLARDLEDRLPKLNEAT